MTFCYMMKLAKRKKGAHQANAHAQIEAGNLEHLTRFTNINKQRLLLYVGQKYENE